MSVDDTIAAVFARMEALGETNTIAFFTSDNGYMWGEHGLSAKRYPYTDSVQVPIYMRWPGHVAEGSDDPRLVSHVDIAPTIYEAVGVTPSYVVDGVSLFSLGARDRLYLEYFRSPDSMTPRTWASIVTPTIQYVEWYDDATGATLFREYYDLVADPWQLVNLLGDANQSNNPDVTALSAQLALDRACSGTACPQPAGGVVDTEPPTTPGTPVASSDEPEQASATFAASTDDVSTLITYRVFRDDEFVGSVSSSSTTTVTFVEEDLPGGTQVSYAVEAVDQAGNGSERSDVSNVVTVMEAPPPPPYLFSDDFSAGLGAWTTVSGVTISTTIGSAAPPSARVAVSNARGWLDKALPTPVPEACASANLNLASIGSGQTVALIRLRGATTSIGRVYVNASRQLRLKNDLSGAQFDGGSLGTGWHGVELCGAVGAAGQLRLYVDGALRSSLTANLGAPLVAGVQIFDNANKTFTANVDDVIVDQAAG
jgi:hypothetical protein